MRTPFSVSIIGLALACAQVSVFAESPKPDPKDPQFQSRGTQHRSYYFKEADERIVYRTYVPSKWTPGSRMPLLIWINPTLNIDLPFERGGNVLEKLAEARGYIVAVPGGYQRPRPFFNSPFRPIPAQPSQPMPNGAALAAEAAALPVDRQRSEQDILNVADLVSAEYDVPPSRVYMFANSTAGLGIWNLAHKYPERWAAVGVASSPISLDGYPFERLKGVPFLVVHGDKDVTYSFAASEDDVRVMKQHGLDAEFLPVKDGTHLEAWCVGLPQILDFFDRHQKK